MTQNRSLGFLIIVVSFLVLAVGCGQSMDFDPAPPQAKDKWVDPVFNPEIPDTVPACEIDMAEYQIDGNVNSFEFGGSFGFEFGYHNGQGHGGIGGTAKVNVSKVRMDLGMWISHPWSGHIYSSGEVSADQTNTSVGGTIDFGDFSAGPQAFFTTPLAEVTRKGLSQGVKDVRTPVDSRPWSGRVIKVNAKTVTINAGSDVGIRVGDVFDLYNLESEWQNDIPCTGQYLGTFRSSSQPIGVVKVLMVDSKITRAEILGVAGTLKRGAEVAIRNLVPDEKGIPRTSLKKEIVLGNVDAKAFTIPGGANFDFAKALNSQIKIILDEMGFVVRQK